MSRGYHVAVYLVAGGEPFRFFETDGREPALLYKGPWETDLLPRVNKYFDEVSGVAAEKIKTAEPETKRVEAERRLHEFVDKESAPKQPPAETNGDHK
jgi:hypothetical protein